MIINPWLFYLIGVADSLSTFFITLGVTLLLGCVVSIIILISCNYSEKYEEESLKKLFKSAIAGVVFLLIAILIPPKDVSYQILAASLATRENIEYVAETGKDLVDYICESAGIILKNEQMVKNHSTGD